MTWLTGDDARYFGLAAALAQGDGYVTAYLPGHPPETITPPGHPFALWLIMELFGVSVLPGKLFSAAMYVAGTVCVWLWSRRVLTGERGLALCVTAMSMLTVAILTMSCWYMAEMHYIFWTFLGLLLSERWRDRSDWRFAVGLGLTAGLSYLVRSVGLAMVAAAVFHFLVQRRWRDVAACAVGAAALAVPWMVRNAVVVGAPDTYMTQFAGMAGAASGMAYPWMRIFHDIAVAFPQYFARDLPSAMFFNLMDGRNLLDLVHVGSLATPVRYGVLALIVAGFFHRARHPGVAEWYWVFYWLLICSPPFPPQGNWYVYPVLPLAALYLVDGAVVCARPFGRRAQPSARVVAAICAFYVMATGLVAAGIHAWKEVPRWRYEAWAPERYCFFNNGYMEAFGRMVDAAQWVASNLPPETIVASRQPQHVHIITGLQGWRYDLAQLEGTNLWDRMNRMAAKGHVALIEDAFIGNPEATFAYGNAHWALRELFEAHSNDVVLVHETAPPVTRVWILKDINPSTAVPE